jgi:hypothetical protein
MLGKSRKTVLIQMALAAAVILQIAFVAAGNFGWLH